MADVVALLCRTTEREAGVTAGVRELGEHLGARIVGEPSPPRDGQWADDLADARGCLAEARRLVETSLAAGRHPLLISGHCAVCIATLPLVAARHPGVRVLWLDAHADFNSPDTTQSGFLGGMCLAGACGVWDAGVEDPPFDPRRVHLVGVRDIDPGEQELLDAHGVRRDPPEHGEVFIHLDLDVLDPSQHPADFPVPDGLSLDDLALVLEDVAERCSIVGVEVTGPAPGHGREIAGTLAPLL